MLDTHLCDAFSGLCELSAHQEASEEKYLLIRSMSESVDLPQLQPELRCVFSSDGNRTLGLSLCSSSTELQG